MAVRTITGNINTLAGVDIPNATFSLIPESYVFGSTSNDVVFGDLKTVVADSNGDVNFQIHEGKYVGRISTSQGAKSFRLTVDSEGPWTLGRLIGELDSLTSSLAAQIFDARDAAEAAVATSVGLQSAIQIRNLSTNYTLSLADAGYLLAFNATATLTIPPQSSVAWPAGTVVAAAQTAPETLTVVGDTDVMVIAAGTAEFGQGQAATLIRTDENEWLLLGDFA